MEFKFKLAVGDQLLVQDTIEASLAAGLTEFASSGALDPDDGGPLNLTGATVQFLAQGPGVQIQDPATVTDAVNGKVQYRFQPGQTAVAGDYCGQWQVTDAAGNVLTWPPKPFLFQIVPGALAALPASFTKLSDLVDDVRAVTGDFKKVVYDDDAILRIMRVQLRLGRIKEAVGPCQYTRWMLGPDNQTITPAITPQDIKAYSLLVYHSAKALIEPDIAAYSYRTRAMSERFGERRDFLFDLENTLYDLESGEGIWSDVTGLRSWLFTINGIWVWSYLQIDQMVDLYYK